MQSFIIVSRNKEEREKYALNLCNDYKIDNFDISVIEQEKSASSESKQTTKSIGINEIRSFKKKIFLKPFRGKTKAVILKVSDVLTMDAQNSLLKILEEPPADTIIIITISNKDSLLGTIHSRCKLIELAKEQVKFSEEEGKKYLDKIDFLYSASLGEKLAFAESFGKNKEEALMLIEKIIILIREKVIKNEEVSRNYLNLLISFQTAYKTISTTNVNVRLTMENVFLSL
ncbi:MAG: hypothetical protein Q7R53_02325 [bacterium]|nr:hypothetical protein [bacterium]